jgi:hypothetical protein
MFKMSHKTTKTKITVWTDKFEGNPVLLSVCEKSFHNKKEYVQKALIKDYAAMGDELIADKNGVLKFSEEIMEVLPFGTAPPTEEAAVKVHSRPNVAITLTGEGNITGLYMRVVMTLDAKTLKDFEEQVKATFKENKTLNLYMDKVDKAALKLLETTMKPQLVKSLEEYLEKIENDANKLEKEDVELGL